MTAPVVHIADHVVSRVFREALRDLLPGLGENPAFWKMLGYLALRPGVKDGVILIGQEVIAAIEGKAIGHGYSAIAFLKKFQRDVVSLEITPSSPGRCRKVIEIHWPEEVERLIREERRREAEEPVTLSSGESYSRRQNDRERHARQDYALELMKSCLNPVSASLLHLLNNAAPRRFFRLKKHLSAARRETDRLALEDADRARRSLPEAAQAAALKTISLTEERQYCVIKGLEHQPQTFFRAAARTVRIFGMEEAVTMLRRETRRIVMQDSQCSDLKSAQLAIVASKWDGGIPAVQEFLRSGESVWTSLTAHMQIPNTEEHKAVLKRLLYCLVFGGGTVKLTAIANELRARAFQKIKQHPVVHALLLARAQELKRIRMAGKIVDAFGKEIQMAYRYVEGKRWSYDSSRELMALQAQSWELKLLETVIASAVEQEGMENGWSLTCWLHDGFCWSPHKQRDLALWTARLQDLVRQQALSLDIVTCLEVAG